MGIEENNTSLVHWNYFLALEQDLSTISRYIEFTESNFETHSIELVHLFLASSSEVDVVLKLLSNQLALDRNHRNINDYKETIVEFQHDLVTEQSYISRFGLTLTPFINWNGNTNPDWWRSYNNVKHQRDQHFIEANLKNTINSMCALSNVILYYYSLLFEKEQNNEGFKEVVSMLEPKSTLIKYNANYYTQYVAWA